LLSCAFLFVFLTAQSQDADSLSITKNPISQLTDTTSVFQENAIIKTYIEEEKTNEIIVTAQAKTLIPSEGFTMNSLWRGALGMLSLLVIAYIFSSNRKHIRW